MREGVNILSKIFSNIFLLNNINNLASLDVVFRRQHNELLQYISRDEYQIERMSDSEKSFIYFWKEVGDREEVIVPEIHADNVAGDKIILYQKAIANLEYSKKKRKDDAGNYLPKSERVNDLDVESLFFEKDEKVYVLINSSNDYHINRVKQLIGAVNIAPNNPEYSLERDLFNWLIYVYTERAGTLNDQTALVNISGFEGNVTDEANVFTGASQQTTELIATKAFISNGGELKKITIRVRDENIDITCIINENSNVVINCNNSQRLRLMDNLDLGTFFQVYLYGYLILKLKQLYATESNNFIVEENPRFSKKIGIDVIKSIIEKNNIVFEDLESFLLVPSSEQELI